MERENTPDQHPATILFVDDNPALLRSVERLLRMEGFQVLVAADGDEAFHRLETASPMPDLIISDISMPRMDGFALFEAVRQRQEWLDIPFLFLTARDQIGDLQRGYALGADDYLVKPLEQERLLMIVRSKLKRREELLGYLQTQQQALDVAKQELAIMVAHELRTPLVSISVVSDLLARDLSKIQQAQVGDLLDAMRSGSTRLSRLVEQMVMHVQLQSGALAAAVRKQTRSYRVHETVHEALTRAQQFDYRRRSVPVSVEEYNPEARLVCDPGSLRQALAELIANAMAFSPLNREIVVTEWVSEGIVWITISDSGPGIPEDELERVLEPFYQVNRRRFEQQGIGMGLPLAKGIIEAHGGCLELQSRVEQGTLVTVSLPLGPDEAGSQSD
ncbi:MAG TPA: response regulator [Aggregatilineaceae bacterium]|nr:response regulator [Aggregatilineaceae bacterium]